MVSCDIFEDAHSSLQYKFGLSANWYLFHMNQANVYMRPLQMKGDDRSDQEEEEDEGSTEEEEVHMKVRNGSGAGGVQRDHWCPLQPGGQTAETKKYSHYSLLTLYFNSRCGTKINDLKLLSLNTHTHTNKFMSAGEPLSDLSVRSIITGSPYP